MSLLRQNKSFVNGFTIVYRRNQSAASSAEESNEFPTDSAASVLISCNKSGLLSHHRNIIHNKTPYLEPSSWIHLTEKYQRKTFGRYGVKSGVNPKICFNAKTNKFVDYYAKLSEPKTFQALVHNYKSEKQDKVGNLIKREEEITKKLEKLNQWKQDLSAKLIKKEAAALAAKEKRDRLIEEVRRHFGYKIDPKDDRFKEVLEQKEREDKKKMKEERRKAKEQKLMSKLVVNSVS